SAAPAFLLHHDHFFFIDAAPPAICTLSLHDALPIYPHKAGEANSAIMRQNVIDWFSTTMESRKNSPDTPIIVIMQRLHENDDWRDRKSTRLNSSHVKISYAVFCLKKKTKTRAPVTPS